MKAFCPPPLSSPLYSRPGSSFHTMVPESESEVAVLVPSPGIAEVERTLLSVRPLIMRLEAQMVGLYLGWRAACPPHCFSCTVATPSWVILSEHALKIVERCQERLASCITLSSLQEQSGVFSEGKKVVQKFSKILPTNWKFWSYLAHIFLRSYYSTAIVSCLHRFDAR